MNRRRAREVAFTILYELDYKPDEQVDEVIELAEQSRGFVADEYVRKTVHGAWQMRDLLDATIEKHAIGWKIKRVSRVLRALMRLSTYEILYSEDVPAPAAIDEAVELAKRYDSLESSAFLNGVLGAFVRGSDSGNGLDARTGAEDPRPSDGQGGGEA